MQGCQDSKEVGDDLFRPIPMSLFIHTLTGRKARDAHSTLIEGVGITMGMRASDSSGIEP